MRPLPLAALAALAAAALAAAPALRADLCVPPGNVCTANDLVAAVATITGPAACTEGATVQATLRVALSADASLRAASERYDVGFFVGNGGEPPLGGADCTVASLNPLGPPVDPTSGSGPYRNLDGDACGDFLRDDPVTVRDIVLDSLLCRDQDGDGRVDVDLALTWKNPSGSCTDPTDPAELFPEQPSKCRLLTDLDVDILVEPAPSMEVLKTALPVELPEPGGTVSYGVSVVNTSGATDPITVTALVDDLYGDLDGLGTCALPVILQPGEVYSCDFEAAVAGVAGQTVTDVVDAAATDDEGEPLAAAGQASVTLVGAAEPIAGRIRAFKLASPGSVLEPGAPVTMTVLVTNASATRIEITALVDDVAGDLDGRGSCAVPQTLLPRPSLYLCQYRAPVAGAAGDVQVSTVTASGLDESGNPVSDDGTATVAVEDRPATMTIAKGAAPASVLEPGGDVEFTVTVVNTSFTAPLVLDSLVDDVYGDLDGQGSCDLPQSLVPRGGTYECAFTGAVAGPEGSESTDVVTAAATAPGGDPLVVRAGATVAIADLPPSLRVTKTATPTAVTEPGGPVVFAVAVWNTSPADDVGLELLLDSVHGNLDGLGTCSLPQTLPAGGAPYRCQFPAFVGGSGGAEERNVVVAAGFGPELEPVAAQAAAVVDVLDTPPAISVHKTASPILTLPGSPVTFSVIVTNESEADTVDLVELDDDVHGDLDGRGDCSLPQTLAPGESYGCQFTEVVDGALPSAEVDRVTAVALAAGGAGGAAVAQDSAIVLLLGAPNVLEIPALSSLGLALLALLLGAIAARRAGAGPRS